jgi:LPS sulfotransferase NodH
MPVQYYVWYEIAGEPSGARAAVDALLADVAQRTGVAGRLHRRRDRPATWMEVYADVVDAAAFEHELAAAVLRHDVVRRSGGGARHVEAFVAAG